MDRIRALLALPGMLWRSLPPLFRDAAERVFWTAAEVYAGYLLAALQGGATLDRVLLYSAAAATLKTLLASFVGDRNTAAMLPRG